MIDVTFVETIDKMLDLKCTDEQSKYENCNIESSINKSNFSAFCAYDEYVELTGIIYGEIKRSIRTGRKVGKKLIRDVKTKIWVYAKGDYERINITISPAYIASLGRIIDNNVLKSQRNIFHLFDDDLSYSNDIMSICSQCRIYADRGVNSVRFIMRLAIMYVYSQFCSIKSRSCFISSNDPVSFVNVSSYRNWSREVINSIAGRNYVPWYIGYTSYFDNFSTVYKILSFACRDNITIGTQISNNAPILWPSISGITLIGDVSDMPEFPDTCEYSDVVIFEVGMAWCARYGSTSLYLELIKIVRLLYWGTEHYNLVCFGRQNSIGLPEADMSAYILAPLMQNISSMKPLTTFDFLKDPKIIAYQTAQLAMMLNFVRQYQQYTIVDFTLEKDIFTDENEKSKLVKILSRNILNDEVAIWGAVDRCWTDFGLSGKLGTIIRSIGLEDTVAEYESFVKMISTHRVSSFDVVPYFKSLPEDLAVARWIGAIPNNEIEEIHTHYFFDDFPSPMKILRCIGELKNIKCFLTRLKPYDRFDVSSKNVSFHSLDDRGYPRDFEHINYTLVDGSQLKWGFKIISLEILYVARNSKHDRYNLKWVFIPSEALTHELVIEIMEETFPDPKCNSLILWNKKILTEEESDMLVKERINRILKSDE